MARQVKSAKAADVEAYAHDRSRRVNIPTAENQGLVKEEGRRLRWPRNPDLDPQLVWRGKDAEDAAPLEVPSVAIYVQEKIKPEAILADLKRRSAKVASQARASSTLPRLQWLAAGLEDRSSLQSLSRPGRRAPTRMILGDFLLVMASLAEREGLRGKVQADHLDPPYGIRFNSNWQLLPPRAATCATARSTASRASRKWSRPSATPGRTASTPISAICATAWSSPATS